MPLNFDSDSNDILWTAEALSQGVVSPGEMMPVVSIIEATNKMGYLIICESNNREITDYVWAKSNIGKHLAVLLASPSEGNDTAILCKAQDKVKNAVLKTTEKKGSFWLALTDENDRNMVVCETKKPAVEKPSKQADSTAK